MAMYSTNNNVPFPLPTQSGCAVALVDAADKKAVEASGLKVLFWSEPSAGIEALPFNNT
jgi:hypothetical protein